MEDSAKNININADSGMPTDGPAAPPTTDVLMPDVTHSPSANGTKTTPVAVAATAAAGSIETGRQPEQPFDTTRQYRSKVNGLGMWSAWERNFSNKLKACLDLIDNAVDAALWDSDDEEDEEEENEGRPLSERERWKKQSGNIRISTEKHRLALGDYDSDDENENDNDRTNGGNGTDNGDSNNAEATPKPKPPPPIIIHDVLGAFGGKLKNTGKNDKDSNAAGGEESHDFRLIDDENTLCLHNDCVNPVKELRKILDVYNSDKTESAIGENGVGVKQAAAAMCDLSIVITTRIDEEPLLMDYGNFERGGGDNSNSNSVKRIRKCQISIGVLAKKMQSAEQCMIPSWILPIEFNIDKHNEKKLRDEARKEKNASGEKGNNGDNNCGEMDKQGGLDEDFIGDTCTPVLMRELSKITHHNRLLGKTMREFGGAATKNRRKYGIQRLAKHIELMVTTDNDRKKAKPPHPHQYLMILHKFGKHRSNDKLTKNSDAAIVKARNELDDLLRDLAEEMPRTYLHIPPAPYFKVRVNREVLQFQYWERHLVELHQIPLVVDRRNDFRTAADWLIPENEDDTYEIKVSIGFDPTRANPHGGVQKIAASNNFIGGQACSLLIFSRISGRLFLKHDDARGVLRLTNSGTNFCQGLTIIVDDFEGHLPLTPTKESLAFGMEDDGKIHERNLYAWLGALANTYWTHFHSLYKTKRALGNAIKAKVESVKQLERKQALDLPTLRFGAFSTVEKLCFSRERVRDSIRPYKSDLTKWTAGPNTLIKLGESKIPKPKKNPIAKKRKATDYSALDGYDSDGNDLMTGAPPPSAFENGASEGNGQDDAEKAPVDDRLDGRPRRATREPQRFEELPEAPKSRKKRLKNKKEKDDNNKGGGDARLNKMLREAEAELLDTTLELNASKATCDDLQVQLEEVEEGRIEESTKISELDTELNDAKAKHKAELQRVEEEYEQQIKELKDRLKELEEKNS